MWNPGGAVANVAADCGPDMRHTLKISIGGLLLVEQEGRFADGFEQGLQCWLTYRFSGDSQVLFLPQAQLSTNCSQAQLKRQHDREV